VFFATESGTVAVVNPGTDLTVAAVNPIGEDIYATPAVAEGRLYVRTTSALYAFGR
jgi:outer membrane protein assembly factor BamB